MTPSDLREALQRFASQAFDWYRYDETLPCERDQEVARAVRAFIAADDEQRAQLTEAVDIFSAHTLVSFAERAASWAVTANDLAHVNAGLVAIAWQWQGCEDTCDGIAVMAALYDATQRLGAQPSHVFAVAESCTPGAHKAAFSAFLSRPDLNDIAPIMGYTLTGDTAEARYLRSW